MRKLSGILAGAALVLASTTASAAPVSVTGAVSVDLGPLGAFTITGTGTVSVVGTGAISNSTGGVTGSQLIVNAGLVTLPTTIVINLTPNQSTLVSSVILNNNLQNGAGTFVSGFVPTANEACPTGNACVVGGGKGGVVPLQGTVTANIGLPVGVMLSQFGIGIGGGQTGLISGEGAPWTTPSGNAQVFTANATVVAGGGADPLTFVTPAYINALGAELPVFATFTFLGLKMVPEPGTLLLLGAGVAGLALVGRRRS